MTESVVVVPVRPFLPTADSLERLWQKFDANRAAFSDELPKTPIAWVAWIAQATVFELGEAANPVGVFIFTAVEDGDQAWAHPFVWERHRYPHAALVEAAKTVCRAMFDAFHLVRINGLTPVTNLPARVFAERVGFKIEGTLREAVSVAGRRENAWVSGLLPADLVAPAVLPARATMEVEEKEVSA